MRNIPTDKYTVAWFKLAECVSRGEKERALGVYRLLSHSLHDAAFARQLQGDILLAFNDATGAIGHYKTAARLYQEDERYLEAAAVYEHLLTLGADKRDYLTTLVELYSHLRNETKIIMHANALFALLLARNEMEEATRIVQQLDHVVPVKETVLIQQQLIFALLAKGSVESSVVMPHIIKVLDHLVVAADTQVLQRLLSSLEALHEECYAQACAYLKEK